MLLLEAFAGDLLSSALVVWASAGDTVLESFILSYGSASILLDACGSGRARSHWQASTSLTRCATLNIVRSLCHADSWTRLKLLNWLPISKAYSCLILVQCLLVCAV